MGVAHCVCRVNFDPCSFVLGIIGDIECYFGDGDLPLAPSLRGKRPLSVVFQDPLFRFVVIFSGCIS